MSGAQEGLCCMESKIFDQNFCRLLSCGINQRQPYRTAANSWLMTDSGLQTDCVSIGRVLLWPDSSTIANRAELLCWALLLFGRPFCLIQYLVLGRHVPLEVKPSFFLKLLVAYSCAVCRYADGHTESRNATWIGYFIACNCQHAAQISTSCSVREFRRLSRSRWELRSPGSLSSNKW
jgi:hypothetical protein